jgi:PIN domain nuclease of toxin-antitoxin system
VLVLDTNALIWIAQGDPMSPAAVATIDAAARIGRVYVPAIVAWEVGLAYSKGRLKLSMDVDVWTARAMALPGLRPLPLTAEVALASTRLPGDFHADPADRMIVAAARALDAPVLTSDRKILAYAKAGHVKAIRAR